MIEIILCLACCFGRSPDQDKRLPVPEPAAQKDAEKVVREIFKEDYAKKASADRIALAKKLFEQGAKTQDDIVSRFVLLREAKDVASQNGDAETALRAVTELARHYEVDSLAMKTALLSAVGKNAQTPDAISQLGRMYLKVADEALAVDSFDLAEKSTALSSTNARRAKDMTLLARADAKAKEVAERKSKYDKIKKAKDTLATRPDDPAANLVIGTFECLTKGNWDAGLVLISNGSDSPLKTQALRDLAKPESANDRVLVGDGWWDLAEKESGTARLNLRARSYYWYEPAAKDLTGLNKVRIDKRVADLRMDKFSGTWSDLGDPKSFGLPGKPGDAMILAPAPGGSKYADLDKLPPGEFDAISARMHVGGDHKAVGAIQYERAKRSAFLDSRINNLAITHVEKTGDTWTTDSSVAIEVKEDYLLMIIVSEGEYVFYVDGAEVYRQKTQQTRLSAVTFEAQFAPVTIDQVKLRKKE